MTTDANPLGRLLGAGVRNSQNALGSSGFGLGALSGLGQQNALGGGQYGEYLINRADFERNYFTLRPQNNDVHITTDGRQKVFINGKWVYTSPTTLIELDTMPVREWLQCKTDEWLGD